MLNFGEIAALFLIIVLFFPSGLCVASGYSDPYPISELTVVGTIKTDDNLWIAYIKSLDGEVHSVKIGNFIGKNHGIIVLISKYEVHILEEIQNPAGVVRKIRRTMHVGTKGIK